MPSRSSSVFLVTLVLIVTAGGALAAWQWRDGLALRGVLVERQTHVAELARLRAENERLQARQIPAAELAALRADHVAILRLRAEIEALRRRP